MTTSAAWISVRVREHKQVFTDSQEEHSADRMRFLVMSGLPLPSLCLRASFKNQFVILEMLP